MTHPFVDYTSLGPELLVTGEGAVRVITMNRPDQLNAFNDRLAWCLGRVWDMLSDDDEARVVILTGAGRAFSAGGDVPSFRLLHENFEARRKAVRGSGRLIEDMIRFHLPVIAAVNGPAVGLGCSLASLCDFVLIADNAYLVDPHVKVGLVAADGGGLTWPLMAGLLKAKKYLLTGDRIPASVAVELGLATEVVPAALLMKDAHTLAARLADMPPQSMQETKRSINMHLAQSYNAVVPFALTAESESFGSDAVAEMIRRFEQPA